MPKSSRNYFSDHQRGLEQGSRGVSEEEKGTNIALPEEAKTSGLPQLGGYVRPQLVVGSRHYISDNLREYVADPVNVPLREDVITEIRFDEGKHDLDTDAKAIISKIYLESLPNWSFILEGYANYRGTPQFNFGLSNRRAIAVLNYFQFIHSSKAAKIKLVNIATFPGGERDEPPRDEFFEIRVKKDRCAKIRLKYVPEKWDPWSISEIDSAADQYEQEMRKKLEYWKNKKGVAGYIKRAARSYAEEFLAKRKADFLRVLKDIFMQESQIREFARLLAVKFGGTEESQLQLVKRDLDGMRPLNYYKFLRNIVHGYVEFFAAGSTGAYKRVPQAFCFIWKDYATFLAGFKTGAGY